MPPFGIRLNRSDSGLSEVAFVTVAVGSQFVYQFALTMFNFCLFGTVISNGTLSQLKGLVGSNSLNVTSIVSSVVFVFALSFAPHGTYWLSAGA